MQLFLNPIVSNPEQTDIAASLNASCESGKAVNKYGGGGGYEWGIYETKQLRIRWKLFCFYVQSYIMSEKKMEREGVPNMMFPIWWNKR